MKKLFYTLLLLFSILSIPSLSAGEIFVTETGAGNKKGSSWNDAYAGGSKGALVDLINNASSGDVIHVGAGTYRPEGRTTTYSFPFKAGVKVYGGYPAEGGDTRDWETNLTILSGDIKSNDIENAVFETIPSNRGDNIEHVLYGNGNIAGALYDGFIIKGGGFLGVAYGGGVYFSKVSNSGPTPVLNNIIIEDCYANNGAAITNESSRKGALVTGSAHVVSISNITIRNNRALSIGGGIFNTTADMIMSDIYLEGNSAGSHGGAIANAVSTVVMNNITANNNKAVLYGGAIVNSTATATMENFELTNNEATGLTSSDGYGGGIVNTTAKVTMKNFVVNNNKANTYGGGIVNTTSRVTMKNFVVTGNKANTYGGGIVNTTARATMNGFVVTENTANTYGGGMVNTTAKITLDNARVNNNTAIKGDGGGIYNTTVHPDSNLVITNLELIGNHAGVGGGGITNTTVRGGTSRIYVEFRNAKINNNTAGSYGGGMFNTTAIVALTDAEVNGNSTQGFGGGLYNTTVNITLKTVKIVGNYAKGTSPSRLTGGGMHNTTVHKQSFWNVLIANNVAEQGFGGGISNTTCYTECEYVNTTIANNYAGDKGGGVYNTTARQTYRNTIVSGNRTSNKETEDFYTVGSGNSAYYQSNFYYSLLESAFGGTNYGTNFAYPSLESHSLLEAAEFADPVAPGITPSLAGDYHLAANSKPIDAGNNDFIRPLSRYAWMEFDLDKTDRIQGVAVDMGAYESVSAITSCDGDIFVNDNVAGGNNNGTSWENAYRSLAEAIKQNLSLSCGHRTIHVAEGTYKPEYALNGNAANDREKTFGITGVTALYLYGGYPDTLTGTNTLVRDPRSYQSILSGHSGSESSYHVVTLQNNGQVWIDGFHITGGLSNGSEGDNTTGAGIYSKNTMLGLMTSEVYDNKATGNGGGIAFYGEVSESFIQDSRIYNNTTDGNGSGIFADKKEDGSIHLINVEVYKNKAEGKGGGIADEGNTLHLINSSLLYNVAKAGGSAISVSTDGITDIHNSIIYGNTGTAVEGSIDYKASLVQDATADGTHILSVEDPLFENKDANDFSLKILSPALYTANTNLFQSMISGEKTDIDGINPRIVNDRINIGARQTNYNLWVGGTENATTAWSEGNNWTLGRVLDANEPLVYFVHAEDDLEMNGDSAVVSYIYNKTDKKLIVGNESFLKSVGKIMFPDTNPEKTLLIRGDKNETGVVGTFIVPEGTVIPATVEYYTNVVTPDTVKLVNDLIFQYMGIPVTEFPASVITNGWVAKPNWYLREYDEKSGSKTMWWRRVGTSETLHPFTGYEIARKNQNGFNRDGIITYTGNLVTKDGEVSLTNSRALSDTHPYAGMHVVSNPYTAGLHIDGGLTFGEHMEQTVYYLTSKTQNGYNGAGSSSMLSVPKAMAGIGELPTAIASMQGFIVKINEGDKTNTSKLTFLYSGTGKNVRLRSAQAATRPYSIVTLNNGSEMKDKMWIFLDDAATFGFDNGYDGPKMFGDKKLAQLYVVADNYKLQVATVPNLSSLTLGFKPEEGLKEYTLQFDHNKELAEAYPELYLHDNETGAITNISSPGASYSFTVSDASLPASNRFQIQTRISTGLERVLTSDIRIQYKKGRILVENDSEAKASILVTDISGRTVASSFVEAGSRTSLEQDFTSGIYIVKATTGDRKTVRKIVVQ